MAKYRKLVWQRSKDESRSKSGNTLLFIIIGIIVAIYLVVFYCIIVNSDLRALFTNNLGYTKENINELYKHLTLVTAGVITLVFQFLRVRINNRQTEEQAKQTKNLSKQVENQAKQVEEQAKQTENLSKEISLKTKTQQDEQFKKAIELLSNSSSTFAARAGAVYMLAALGCESQTHAQSCLDMLAELSRWMGQRLASDPDYFDRGKEWHSQVLTYDEESLKRYYAIIEPKKEPNENLSKEERQQAKESLETEDLSKEEQLQAKESLEAEDLSKEEQQQAKESLEAEDLSKEEHQQAKESLEAEDLSRLAILKIADIIQTHAHDDATPNKKLSNFNLQGKSLCQLNLLELQLGDRINFSNTRLQGANLVNAQMQGANLEGSQMQGADLCNTQMQGANLRNTHMQRTDLTSTQMQSAYLTSAQMQGADLENTQMQGAILWHAQMQGVDLHNANMQGAKLENADMQGVDLHNANMQGASLVNANMQGANFRNTNMRGISIVCDLSTFEERVSSRSDVEKLEDDQTGKLTDEHIKTIIEALEKNKNVSPSIIKKINERLQSRKDQDPQLDGITYGKLSQKECDSIIKDYNEAMKSVPKKQS